MTIKDNIMKELEVATGKPVFDKRNPDDSYNNNSYIINITSYSSHTGRARGFIVFSGEYEVIATDLQNIPNFTFIDDIITTNNYFQDDVIHSQDFVYIYDKTLTTKDNTKVENII